MRATAAALSGAVQAALARLETMTALDRAAAATVLGRLLLEGQGTAATVRARALEALARAQGSYAAAAAALTEIGEEIGDAQLAGLTPEAVGQAIRRARRT